MLSSRADSEGRGADRPSIKVRSSSPPFIRDETGRLAAALAERENDVRRLRAELEENQETLARTADILERSGLV
jgi:hypothetical protein